jgi:hypothetical protein
MYFSCWFYSENIPRYPVLKCACVLVHPVFYENVNDEQIHKVYPYIYLFVCVHISEQINILMFITKGKVYFWTVNLIVYLFGCGKVKMKLLAFRHFNSCGVNTNVTRYKFHYLHKSPWAG